MQSAYSLTREVIAAIREGLPEADQMQPGQVFQHHMFGRLKRHSFCFLLSMSSRRQHESHQRRGPGFYPPKKFRSPLSKFFSLLPPVATLRPRRRRGPR